MKNDEFKEILGKIVLPMFTGSEIIEMQEANERMKSVAFDDGKLSLLIKPKNENYRFKIRRQQIFSNDDMKIIESIINEIAIYYKMPDEYKKESITIMVESAIANYLGDNNINIETIRNVLFRLKEWSGRTYEGRDVSFGIEIQNISNKNKVIKIDDILQYDFAALLSDGVESMIKVDCDGYFVGIINSAESDVNSSYVPYRFNKIAKSLEDGSVGIILLRNKEILILKNSEIIFAFRRGIWRHFNHKAVVQKMAAGSKYTKEEIRLAIYESCMDVSFSRTGGSITYLRKSMVKKCIEEIMDEDDIIKNEKTIKAKTIKSIVGKKVCV